MSETKPLKLEKVIIYPLRSGNNIDVVFSGIIDIQDPVRDILPYLLSIHQYIIEEKIDTVKMDLTDLSFMNSSGIKTIIQWIIRLKNLPPAERYSMRVAYNPDITWQESSIEIMQQLFPDIIIVEGN